MDASLKLKEVFKKVYKDIDGLQDLILARASEEGWLDELVELHDDQEEAVTDDFDLGSVAGVAGKGLHDAASALGELRMRCAAEAEDEAEAIEEQIRADGSEALDAKVRWLVNVLKRLRGIEELDIDIWVHNLSNTIGADTAALQIVKSLLVKQEDDCKVGVYEDDKSLKVNYRLESGDTAEVVIIKGERPNWAR